MITSRSTSSNLRLSCPPRTPIISRHFSIRRLSLQAHGISKRRRIVLQLLFSLLLESLLLAAILGARVVGRGLGICGFCFERYWVAELGWVFVILLAGNVFEGLVVLLMG